MVSKFADLPSVDPVRVFFSGDVMTGRGIDQILATPGEPTLYEPSVKSAVRYVEIAERVSGPIPRGVGPEYVWGDAMAALDQSGVDVRIVNLETAVTDSGEPWPAKGIHYRMHPANIDILEAADIDCCVLSNNHILDWSRAGLTETLDSLHGRGIATVGAGDNADQAARPAVIESKTGPRVVVVAFGSESSGIPGSWAAGSDRPGVNLLRSLTGDAVVEIDDRLSTARRPGDMAVASVHWGANWGYEIPLAHRRFAEALIDDAGVDVVHGHSSHHPIGVQVYQGRLILYGCGDLINDYEGIGGHEEVRPGLGVLYLATFDGGLQDLEMIPMRLRRFRLERADADDVAWLARTLTQASRPFGTRIDDTGDGRLRLVW